ncbi:MAG: hypothetical protein M0Z61_06315 [Nitrospiraceae bacterium]|nr:hypothetical protein [Nitrospiraceae bacterium]
MSENLKTIGNPDDQSEKTVSILKLPERAAYEGGVADPDKGTSVSPGNEGSMNAIIKGSKLTGNMIITHDLEGERTAEPKLEKDKKTKKGLFSKKA